MASEKRHMNKLLLLGNNYHVDVLIKLARKRGIYVIVTDNLPIEDSLVKKMADEYWDISVSDVDSLEIKARESGVNAVLCGASELCMSAVRELSKRLNLPFYVPDKAWEITNDKNLFKEACLKCGLTVAENFKLSIDFLTEDLKKIEYPVVVKPVDGIASIGMHICRNEQDLIAGYRDAWEHSKSKQVVVEKYCVGDEVMLMFTFSDGKYKLLESTDVIGDKFNGRPFLYGSAPTKYLEMVNNELKKPLEELFRLLECKEGVGVIQGIMDKGKLYILEMNYRLPGAKIIYQEYLCNYILDYTFKEDYTKDVIMPIQPDVASYIIWLAPGVISRIEGLEDIKEKYPNLMADPTKKVGDIIEQNSGMRQIFIYFVLVNYKDIYDSFIDYVNKTLKIYDENGNDMIYRYYRKDGIPVPYSE